MGQKKLTLQEQLLQSGLVSSDKAKRARTEKHKQNQLQRNNKVQMVNEAKELALKAQAEKLERDKELNKAKQEEETKKQIAAQIRQLIEQNRIVYDEEAIEEYDDSSAYHFTDGNKVKKLFVPPDIRTQIASGKLAIVRSGKRYNLVPAAIAVKIRERNADSVVVLIEPDKNPAHENDPYADYQVPDDLMW